MRAILIVLASLLPLTVAQAQAPATNAPTAAAPPSAAAPATPATAPSPAATSQSVKARHGVALFGEPALPPDFKNFPYVNPDAPKGGEVVLGALGSFDSFNGFIFRGTPAAEVSRVYDTLLRASSDEPSVGYGHSAQSIEIPPDHKSVAFELRPEAKFHDGTPVTADDVAWTFNMLKSQGAADLRPVLCRR